MDLDGFVGSVSGFSSLQKRSGLAEHGGRSLKMAKAVNYNVSSTMSTEANSLYCGKWHGNMNGGQGGSRGLFTPSQWLELEHQALIYKHISSNVPIPSHLLNPIRKAFRFSPCNGFSAGTYRSNSLGWGSFNLGFSGNSDPEPGRCRRTDGKKWRCSRDAMADQKYCERHMNRGRHRSRKPVEGLPGHVASSIVSNRAASPPPTETVILGSNSFMYQTRSSASTETFRRDITSKEIENEHLQDLHSSSVRSSANLASNDASSSSFLEQYIPFKDNPQIEFSLPSSVSNSNPPKSFSASDEIPETRSDHLALVWLDTEHIQSEETLHSISSYSSLPYPLKMGSTTGFHPEMTQNEEQNHDSSPRQSYFGGPLGEVLNKTGNQTDENSKSLHLISDYWDEIPPLMFSPTRILHKDPFETPSNCTSDSVSAEEKPTF